MSAKYTPGPWTDEAVTQSQSELMRGPLPQDFLVYGADGTVIGVFYDYINRAPANARLIAAAPDLLDALKAGVAHSDALQASGYPRGRDLQPLYDAAVAAIAKAEGKQS